MLETGVKSDVAFCLGSSIEKTNSDLPLMPTLLRTFQETFPMITVQAVNSLTFLQHDMFLP